MVPSVLGGWRSSQREHAAFWQTRLFLGGVGNYATAERAWPALALAGLTVPLAKGLCNLANKRIQALAGHSRDSQNGPNQVLLQASSHVVCAG